MTVMEEVQALLARQTPNAICDDCIKDALKLSVRQHANHKTRQLATDRSYDRRKDECAICGASKLVIRSNLSTPLTV